MPFVVIVTVSAAFVFGMVLALLGSLKLSLAKRLDLGEGRIGMLLSAFNLTLMPMMVLTGLLIDRYGVRWVLIGASAITAVAIVFLSIQPTFNRAFVGVLLAGFGSAGLSTSSIVLMPVAFYGMPQASASLNLGNVFFALGALITPVLADVLLRSLGFQRGITFVAILCLVPALFAAMASDHALKLTAEPGAVDRALSVDFPRLFSDRTLWLAAAVFFLYAPLEAAINIWATTYMTDFGHSERGAAWVLSGFWAAFLSSRLLAALALHQWPQLPGWDVWLIILPSLGVAVLLGNLAGTASSGAAWRGLIFLGFLLGPIFPTLVGSLFQRLAGVACYGTAYGALFATGSLGSLLLAPMIGVRAKHRNVQSALRIPMVLAIAMTFAALVFVLVTGK